MMFEKVVARIIELSRVVEEPSDGDIGSDFSSLSGDIDAWKSATEELKRFLEGLSYLVLRKVEVLIYVGITHESVHARAESLIDDTRSGIISNILDKCLCLPGDLTFGLEHAAAQGVDLDAPYWGSRAPVCPE